MKTKILLSLVAITVLSFTSAAYADRDDRRPHEPPHHEPPHHEPEHGHHRGCSPEVVKSNVSTVEQVLNATAARSDFANAITFKSTISTIQSSQDVNQRVEAYMAIVGIDSMDQVADLLGGEHADAYIENARSNLDLSKEQAQVVVDSLSKALRGNLQ